MCTVYINNLFYSCRGFKKCILYVFNIVLPKFIFQNLDQNFRTNIKASTLCIRYQLQVAHLHCTYMQLHVMRQPINFTAIGPPPVCSVNQQRLTVGTVFHWRLVRCRWRYYLIESRRVPWACSDIDLLPTLFLASIKPRGELARFAWWGQNSHTFLWHFWRNALERCKFWVLHAKLNMWRSFVLCSFFKKYFWISMCARLGVESTREHGMFMLHQFLFMFVSMYTFECILRLFPSVTKLLSPSNLGLRAVHETGQPAGRPLIRLHTSRNVLPRWTAISGRHLATLTLSLRPGSTRAGHYAKPNRCLWIEDRRRQHWKKVWSYF